MVKTQVKELKVPLNSISNIFEEHRMVIDEGGGGHVANQVANVMVSQVA